MGSSVKQPSKPDHEKHARTQALLEAIYYGKTDSLQCPACGSSEVEFSYTYVEPDNYGIWFTCLNCQHWGHQRLKAKPPGFDANLILEKYQQKAEQTVRQTDRWWQAVSDGESKLNE